MITNHLIEELNLLFKSERESSIAYIASMCKSHPNLLIREASVLKRINDGIFQTNSNLADIYQHLFAEFHNKIALCHTMIHFLNPRYHSPK